MKKTALKRLGLSAIQHFFAAAIMLIIAAIVLNSHVAVESMDGTKTYMVNSYGSEETFEESGLFRNIFENAVSDITRLVVMKGQLETDGVFDPAKRIDVTQYANRKGNGNNCPITAVYELDSLIKWGKNGIEYTNRPWSISDFVNYYGEVVLPDNFEIDDYGQLYFRGFTNEPHSEKEKENVAQLMSAYTVEQLEEMVFSYIIAQVPQGISLSREDDGTLTVYLTALNCQYETVDGEKQLLTYADNWIDYMKLQNNLADTITSLTNNYQQYQNCNELYEEENSNLKYAVRMMTEDGLRTYTNVAALAEVKESEITEFFSEYRSYFIYYPDSLEFFGNTSLTQDDIYKYMREYDYAYPETTHIWIGVDTLYPIEGDAFYNANEVFQRIIANLEVILVAIVLLFLAWMSIGIYLTVTAGVKYNEEGERIRYLTRFDYMWTELLFFLGLLYVFFCAAGFRKLMEIADSTYISQSELIRVIGSTELYKYGLFVIYGLLVSMFLNLLWYSLVRRLRKGRIWRGSFLCWMVQKLGAGVDFVLSHGNTAVSILIPYNFFLMVNLFGFFLIYMVRNRALVVLVALLILVAFDGCIGMLLFKNSAERLDIVEGIRRIREGEVDYKLDVDSLHGTNREMADAVNNIGEGIRNAVKTSMKDEQMKTDLITNVSHDIKTPLTSIISYVDLLKRLKIEEEPAKSYIAILDNKSQRLKQLTDDLVEASKISSGNIELKKEELNLTELLNQAIGEFSEKLEERQLQVVFEGSDIPAHIYADSRRMWRVIENLFNNIYKYAMNGTRVYIDLEIRDNKVEVSIKNISERQMNIHADELTERFIRGDESRTTEGSGLGLSIAKSLIQVQGGSFIIHLDGDLFKVVISFPEYVSETIGEVTEEIKAEE